MAKLTKWATRLGNNLSGDLDKLVGALSGLRTDVFSGITDGLRGLTQTATQWVNQLRGWVQANPELARTLVIAGGSALALTAAIGATSLAAGLLLGPLAKLQLGFTLLTGMQTTRTELDRYGKAKKIEFSLSFQRCDEDLRERLQSSSFSDLMENARSSANSAINTLKGLF
ncbi:MAG: phage tail tape measure protein [Symbiopectobacterium sp.]|uniref:phage tail tape measure protein n=1 Tax=Symbiopectobacterium sp. TaxID=2952789 RepID=UPI0039E812B8